MSGVKGETCTLLLETLDYNILRFSCALSRAHCLTVPGLYLGSPPSKIAYCVCRYVWRYSAVTLALRQVCSLRRHVLCSANLQLCIFLVPLHCAHSTPASHQHHQTNYLRFVGCLASKQVQSRVEPESGAGAEERGEEGRGA